VQWSYESVHTRFQSDGGGVLPGFHLGVLNPILPAVRKDLELSTSGQSLVFSVLILAAACGALGAGKVCQRKEMFVSSGATVVDV
jgi:MFS family permease